jgi:probable F420-dependent oxidoreductase
MDTEHSMPTRMRIGVMPDAGGGPVPRFADLRDQARLAEQMGFDSFWVPDHLLYRHPGQPESGRWDGLTALAGLASATERIQLGPLVACTAFRNAGLLAKTADTLDEISGGRFILGLGAGWHEPEFAAYGYPFDHRASRFEESLRIITSALRTGAADLDGTYAQARNLHLVPRGPSPHGPPIWIGARGPRLQRLTARYADAWNAAWFDDPAELARRWEAVRGMCEEEGRDPDTLELTVGTYARVLGPGEQRSADALGLVGSAEEVAELLRGFREVGARHAIIAFIQDQADNAPRFLATLQRYEPVLAALAGD